MAQITAERLPIKYGESFSAELGAAITAIGSGGGGGYAAVIRGASDGLVIQSAAIDTIVLGFLRLESLSADIPALGEQVEVFFSGIVWAVSASAIVVNTELAPAAAGRVDEALVADQVCGIAMTTVAGAGERFPMMIRFKQKAA